MRPRSEPAAAFFENNSGASPRGFALRGNDSWHNPRDDRAQCRAVHVIHVLAAASSTAAQSVMEKEKFDVEQARVYVATVQPHRPVLAPRGHTTNRVFIYMDDGVMTRREGDSPTKTIVFHRGDVGWIPASSGYVSENTTDRPVRILMVDLKGTPSGPAPVTKLDPAVVDPRHYTVVLENDQVRVLRVH